MIIKNKNYKGTLQSFKIRKTYIQAALEWLIKNNPGYQDIHIDNTILQSLPYGGILDDIFISRDISEEEDVSVSSDSRKFSQANQLPHVSNNIDQGHNGLLTSDINKC